VGDDRQFLSGLVTEKATRIRSALPLAKGRGASLVVAARAVCDRLTQEAEALAAIPTPSDAQLKVHARTLLRAQQQLDLLHVVVARYSSDVGRSDLPVGLMYLVDELIRDLLPQGADPLIHLGRNYMYSTLPLLEAAQGVMKPHSLPHPHPVAFHVPGLSPTNAMLAPILAHEVGHTSWSQAVNAQLDGAFDRSAVESELKAGVKAGATPKELKEGFEFWCQELMCDALAATLTGPSFLFASAYFLPAPAEGRIGGHPYPRDRIRFTLRILEEHDWIPVLQDLVPEVLAWCQELAASPELGGSPAETALRQAMVIMEPAMIRVASGVAQNRVTADQFMAYRQELFDHLDLEIPPVSAEGIPCSPWLIILAGWLHELRSKGADSIDSIPGIASGERLNRFLLKTVELSGVMALWGGHDPAAS
jgi:hypothetical protein